MPAAVNATSLPSPNDNSISRAINRITRDRHVTAFLPWWRKDNLFLSVAWRDLPMPVIAVTHDYYFGGEFQIALDCNFRISVADCEFSIMEID